MMRRALTDKLTKEDLQSMSRNETTVVFKETAMEWFVGKIRKLLELDLMAKYGTTEVERHNGAKASQEMLVEARKELGDKDEEHGRDGKKGKKSTQASGAKGKGKATREASEDPVDASSADEEQDVTNLPAILATASRNTAKAGASASGKAKVVVDEVAQKVASDAATLADRPQSRRATVFLNVLRTPSTLLSFMKLVTVREHFRHEEWLFETQAMSKLFENSYGGVSKNDHVEIDEC